MGNKIFFWLLIFNLLLGSSIFVNAGENKHSYQPKEGFVPNGITAIRIAEAVWIPIYGEKQILKQRPFKASLKKGIWTVMGSLPEGWIGGVAEAEISKKDGRIIRVSHGE